MYWVKQSVRYGVGGFLKERKVEEEGWSPVVLWSENNVRAYCARYIQNDTLSKGRERKEKEILPTAPFVFLCQISRHILFFLAFFTLPDGTINKILPPSKT
jgi:hypothetical protein